LLLGDSKDAFGESEVIPANPPSESSRSPEQDSGRESEGSEDGIAEDDEGMRLARAFLAGRVEAVRAVADWARPIATHNVWGFEMPEDVVQAALVAMVQNLRAGRFKGGNLRAYVRRITKNLCITNYRRARAHGVHVALEDEAPAPASSSSGEEIEQRALLDRILARLDETCRQIVLMAYLHGYSRREIGSHLGITEEAARVRLYRCVQNARAMLSQS
jgi:RNA polymerase sigma-70 factor (ECF subfamily)